MRKIIKFQQHFVLQFQNTAPICDEISTFRDSPDDCRLYLTGCFPPCCGDESIAFTITWMINNIIPWEMYFTTNRSNCSVLHTSSNGIPADELETAVLVGGADTVILTNIVLNTTDGSSFVLGNRTIGVQSLLCLSTCMANMSIPDIYNLKNSTGCIYNVSITLHIPYNPLLVQSTQLIIGDMICLPHSGDLGSNSSLVVYQCEAKSVQSRSSVIVTKVFADQCMDNYTLVDVSHEKICGKIIRATCI